MPKIQDVFNRIQETKNKQKELKAIYKDALANSFEYQDIADKIKKLKEKKKEIESAISSDFSSEFAKLDSIKLDLESDNLMLSDMALNHVMKGELIEIKDADDNKYEPLFNVKFRKI